LLVLRPVLFYLYNDDQFLPPLRILLFLLSLKWRMSGTSFLPSTFFPQRNTVFDYSPGFLQSPSPPYARNASFPPLSCLYTRKWTFSRFGFPIRMRFFPLGQSRSLFFLNVSLSWLLHRIPLLILRHVYFECLSPTSLPSGELLEDFAISYWISGLPCFLMDVSHLGPFPFGRDGIDHFLFFPRKFFLLLGNVRLFPPLSFLIAPSPFPHASFPLVLMFSLTQQLPSRLFSFPTIRPLPSLGQASAFSYL